MSVYENATRLTESFVIRRVRTNTIETAIKNATLVPMLEAIMLCVGFAATRKTPSAASVHSIDNNATRMPMGLTPKLFRRKP